MNQFLDEFYLYNTFFNTDKYKTLKGDGGPEFNIIMQNHIKSIKDEKLLKKIIDEIEVWLEIGSASYFISAVNIIVELNLVQYIEELKEKRIAIIKRNRDLPLYFADYIESALKRFNKTK
jgi:hypothetical protein